MDVRWEGQDEVRAHMQQLTHDIITETQKTPQEIAPRIGLLIQRTFQQVDLYEANPQEHSLLARVEILGKLHQALNHSVFVDFQEIQQARAWVNLRHLIAKQDYEAAWEPIYKVGISDFEVFETSAVRKLSEAAFLLSIEDLKSNELTGAHLGVMQNLLNRDLEAFLQNGNIPLDDRMALNQCLETSRASKELNLELFCLEEYYSLYLTSIPLPTRIQEIAESQFDLSTLYAMKNTYEEASPELTGFIEKKIEDCVFKIQTRIKNLAVGQECLIPGGFIGLSARFSPEKKDEEGHASLYQIERVEPSADLLPRYKLTLVDSGYGVETQSKYYNKYLGISPNDLTRNEAYDQVLLNLTEEQILNKNMWTALVRCQTLIDAGPSSLNHVLTTLLSITDQEKFERGRRHEAYAGPSCSYWPILIWLEGKVSPTTYLDFKNHVKSRVLHELEELKDWVQEGDEQTIKELDAIKTEIHKKTENGIFLLNWFSKALEPNESDMSVEE